MRNYKAQAGETHAMLKAQNKLTGLGMPETQYIVWYLNDLEFLWRHLIWKQNR